MKMIVHDLLQQEFDTLYKDISKDVTVIMYSDKIKNCIGCFGCWIKTPGVCVIKDGYHNIGELLSKCDELIVISRCIYGSYSPFIRNVFDRSISYLLPYFNTKKGETHHKPRYKNSFNLSVYFYSEDITNEERKTAEQLVIANSTNFYANKYNLYFCKTLQDIKEVMK